MPQGPAGERRPGCQTSTEGRVEIVIHRPSAPRSNVETEDVLAVQRIINLYGVLIDDERWDDLAEVFTDDAVLEVRPLAWTMRGVREIAAGYSGIRHPLGHHMTNTVLAGGSTDDEATGITKFITVRQDGSSGTGVYEDRFVRTPAGWRIAERVAKLRSTVPPVVAREQDR